MEPQLSVLLYSKYSALSKRLMNIMNTSDVDFTSKFSMQPLCIDNEEIRNRVLKNKQIEISTVPCLLVIFPDGGIEKYDGVHIFEWVEGIIRQFASPSQPLHIEQPRQPPRISEEETWRLQQVMEQKRVQERKITEDRERSKIREENKRLYEQKQQEKENPTSGSRTKTNPSSGNRRKPVRKHDIEDDNEDNTANNTGVTSIDDLEDLPTDEEDNGVSDRYRLRKPVGRIRSNEGNYEEGNELFQGPTPNMRKAKKSAIKGANSTESAKSQKSIDIMSRAKALAQGREESTAPPPPGHPLSQRN